MRKLGREKHQAFCRAHLNGVGEVLVEGPFPGRPGWLRALSADYLRVALPGPPEWRNRRLEVRFLAIKDETLLGEVITRGG
jgi:threonylcarbamoyladenosine tRNA methylthiotransferase MtaB